MIQFYYFHFPLKQLHLSYPFANRNFRTLAHFDNAISDRILHKNEEDVILAMLTL